MISNNFVVSYKHVEKIAYHYLDNLYQNDTYIKIKDIFNLIKIL